MCSTLIPGRLPEQFRRSLRTSQAISSSSGMDFSTGNNCTPTVIGCPSIGMCQNISTRSTVMVAMDTLAGGGGQSKASLYHPRIQIHASRMKGGSEARRDSTDDPVLTTLRRWSSWRLALIVRLIPLELRCSPVWSAAILASMRRQVSTHIHAWRRRSCCGGLGMAYRRSSNRGSNPSGLVGSLIFKRMRLLR